jgi:hypothetical protein
VAERLTEEEGMGDTYCICHGPLTRRQLLIARQETRPFWIDVGAHWCCEKNKVQLGVQTDPSARSTEILKDSQRFFGP